jgi:hypothetical protein
MKTALEIDWTSVQHSLDNKGFVLVNKFLNEGDCKQLEALYEKGAFRSVINMERYRFGKGEYKYFSYPIPQLIESIRTDLYPPLAAIANAWMQTLNIDKTFPDVHGELIAQCHAHNQKRPTPLILKYGVGGFNTLHQDLYGEIFFPFQIVFLLNPESEFEGGEFVLVEQVPRAQSKARVVKLQMGDALIFTTNFRPAKSSKGYYRAAMKHGVSEIISGERYALGIIFHDAA